MEQRPVVSMVQRKDIAILEIQGDVTDVAEEPLLDAFQRATRENAKKILLKFNRSNYLNSAGIAVIITLVSDARNAGQQIGVTGLSAHFKNVFETIGLVDFVRMFDNEEDAVTQF